MVCARLIKTAAPTMLLLLLLPMASHSFQVTVSPSCSPREATALMAHFPREKKSQLHGGRRSFVSTTGAALLGIVAGAASPPAALAGIDPSMLKTLPVEGDTAGTATRLRQIEAIEKPASDLENIPYVELPSGVSYREYREGKGEAVVKEGSKVAVEMTIRCKSFATNKEPGGVKYFSTKDDTEFNEVAFTVGSGEVPPGLEEGMMGMHKNALRRIELPSTMVFAAKKAGQLPLPQTKDGKRRFENLFKTDATLLFEVLVTRIK